MGVWIFYHTPMIIIDEVNKDIRQTILQISYRLQENLDQRVSKELITHLIPLENQADLITNIEDLSFPEIRSIIIAQTHWILDLEAVIEVQEEAANVLQDKLSDIAVLLDSAEDNVKLAHKSYQKLHAEYINKEDENTKLLDIVSDYEAQLKAASAEQAQMPDVADLLYWQNRVTEIEKKYHALLDFRVIEGAVKLDPNIIDKEI